MDNKSLIASLKKLSHKTDSSSMKDSYEEYALMSINENYLENDISDDNFSINKTDNYWTVWHKLANKKESRLASKKLPETSKIIPQQINSNLKDLITKSIKQNTEFNKTQVSIVSTSTSKQSRIFTNEEKFTCINQTFKQTSLDYEGNPFSSEYQTQTPSYKEHPLYKSLTSIKSFSKLTEVLTASEVHIFITDFFNKQISSIATNLQEGFQYQDNYCKIIQSNNLNNLQCLSGFFLYCHFLYEKNNNQAEKKSETFSESSNFQELLFYVAKGVEYLHKFDKDISLINSNETSSLNKQEMYINKMLHLGYELTHINNKYVCNYDLISSYLISDDNTHHKILENNEFSKLYVPPMSDVQHKQFNEISKLNINDDDTVKAKRFFSQLESKIVNKAQELKSNKFKF